MEVEYIGQFDLTVGDVIELLSFKGKDRKLDNANSGFYVIGRLERQFISQNDNMSTRLTLYTDSPVVKLMSLEAVASFIGKEGFNWWIGTMVVGILV